MVASCCICKISHGQKENISFHSIPTNEELRKKWLAVIKRNVSKSSKVCSSHFQKTDFKYQVQNDVIKKSLLRTAVPSLFVNNDENSSNYNDISGIQKFNVPDNLDNEHRITNSAAEDIDSQHQNEVLHERCSELKEELEHGEISFEWNNSSDSFENTSTILNENFSCAKTSIIENNNSKPIKRTLTRSHSETSFEMKRPRSMRYVGDLTREDFTSDRAYQIVLKYYEDTNKKLKDKNKCISRLKGKIGNVKELLDHLKESGLITREGSSALEVRVS